MDSKADKKLAPPYNLPFKTFLTALDHLKTGVPSHLDRSAFPSLAGGLRPYVISAFRFMELIDDDYSSSHELERLAQADETERIGLLRDVIERSYAPFLMLLDLKTTTPKRFKDTFTEAFGVGGETGEKSQRFFLAAAKYTGIPMAHLLERTQRANTGSPRKRKAPRGESGGAARTATRHTPPPSGDSREAVVRLGDAGLITVKMDVDLFKLSGEMREKFFSFVDFLKGIAELNDPSPTGGEESLV